ncbi:MAG: hypothetical protein HUK21_03235 [Fibrobacteraceae bacterium]|mgnify:CR=1 FL=1|nr:hypothetical protein [Fibrobacteraceae bacterium]
MIYSYKQCKERIGSDFLMLREIECGHLYKLAAGAYSYTPDHSELELFQFLYPNAVFTMGSAFYYHELTDVVPEKLEIASVRDSSKIKLDYVKQHFYPEKTFSIGVSQIEWQGEPLKLYDKERMLIELIRHKNKIPFDFYKEIVTSYRNVVMDLDTQKLEDYTIHFPASKKILDTIQLEIF